MTSAPIFAEPASRQATIAWTDPAVLYTAHEGMSSIDLFRAVMAGTAPIEPAMALIGAEIESVEPGVVVLALRLGERHLDHSGHVHNGILAALTDTAAGYAVHTERVRGAPRSNCMPVSLRRPRFRTRAFWSPAEPSGSGPEPRIAKPTLEA